MKSTICALVSLVLIGCAPPKSLAVYPNPPWATPNFGQEIAPIFLAVDGEQTIFFWSSIPVFKDMTGYDVLLPVCAPFPVIGISTRRK